MLVSNKAQPSATYQKTDWATLVTDQP